VHFNPLARNHVLPVAYARWQPAPKWTVSLGAPRTEVAYQYDAATSFFAGGSLEGALSPSTIRVKSPPVTPACAKPNSTTGEIRVAPGCTAALSRDATPARGRRGRRPPLRIFRPEPDHRARLAAFFALSFVASF